MEGDGAPCNSDDSHLNHSPVDDSQMIPSDNLWFSSNDVDCCFAWCQCKDPHTKNSHTLRILTLVLLVLDSGFFWSLFIYLNSLRTEFVWWKSIDWPVLSTTRLIVHFIAMDKALVDRHSVILPLAVLYYFMYGICVSFGLFRLGLLLHGELDMWTLAFVLVTLSLSLAELLVVYFGVYSLPFGPYQDPEEIKQLLGPDDIQEVHDHSTVDVGRSALVESTSLLSKGKHVIRNDADDSLVHYVTDAIHSGHENQVNEPCLNCIFPVLNRTDNVSFGDSNSSASFQAADQIENVSPINASEHMALCTIKTILQAVWSMDIIPSIKIPQSTCSPSQWQDVVTLAEHAMDSSTEMFLAAQVLHAELLFIKFWMTKTASDHLAIDECLRKLETQTKGMMDKMHTFEPNMEMFHGLGMSSYSDENGLKTCKSELNVLLAQVLLMRGIDQILYQGRDIKGGLKSWSILQKVMLDTKFPWEKERPTSPTRGRVDQPLLSTFPPFIIEQRIQEGICICLSLFQIALEYYPRELSAVLKPLGIMSQRGKVDLLKRVALGKGYRAPLASVLLILRLAKIVCKPRFTSHMICMRIPLISCTEPHTIHHYASVVIDSKFKHDIDAFSDLVAHLSKYAQSHYNSLSRLSLFHHYALHSIYQSFGLFDAATEHLERVFSLLQMDANNVYALLSNPSMNRVPNHPIIPVTLVYEYGSLLALKAQWESALLVFRALWSYTINLPLHHKVDLVYQVGCYYVSLLQIHAEHNEAVVQVKRDMNAIVSHVTQSDYSTLLDQFVNEKWDIGKEFVYLMFYFGRKWTSLGQSEKYLELHVRHLASFTSGETDVMSPCLLLVMGALGKLELLVRKSENVKRSVVSTVPEMKQNVDKITSILQKCVLLSSSPSINAHPLGWCASYASYEMAELMTILGHRISDENPTKQLELKILVAHRELAILYLKQCMQFGSVRYWAREEANDALQESPVSSPNKSSNPSDLPGILKITSPYVSSYPRLSATSYITPIAAQAAAKSIEEEDLEGKIGSLSSSIVGSFASSLGSSVVLKSTVSDQDKLKGRKYHRFLFYHVWKAACILLLDDIFHHE